jgi:hypothetical protein
MDKLQCKELVLNIFGKDASEDDDIVDFYMRVNEVAIEENSKQESIRFAEWISNHRLDFQTASNGQWIGLDLNIISSETLYETCLNESTKEKQ